MFVVIRALGFPRTPSTPPDVPKPSLPLEQPRYATSCAARGKCWHKRRLPAPQHGNINVEDRTMKSAYGRQRKRGPLKLCVQACAPSLDLHGDGCDSRSQRPAESRVPIVIPNQSVPISGGRSNNPSGANSRMGADSEVLDPMLQHPKAPTPSPGRLPPTDRPARDASQGLPCIRGPARFSAQASLSRQGRRGVRHATAVEARTAAAMAAPAPRPSELRRSGARGDKEIARGDSARPAT